MNWFFKLLENGLFFLYAFGRFAFALTVAEWANKQWTHTHPRWETVLAVSVGFCIYTFLEKKDL